MLPRCIYAAASGLMLLPLAAAAQQSDPMQAYYGNTLVCRSAQEQCHLWFKDDGTYKRFEVILGKDGDLKLVGVEGKFMLSDKDGVAQTCLANRGIGGPMGGRATECYPLAGHKVGDHWNAKKADGSDITFTLQSGHRVNGHLDFMD